MAYLKMKNYVKDLEKTLEKKDYRLLTSFLSKWYNKGVIDLEFVLSFKIANVETKKLTYCKLVKELEKIGKVSSEVVEYAKALYLEVYEKELA